MEINAGRSRGTSISHVDRIRHSTPGRFRDLPGFFFGSSHRRSLLFVPDRSLSVVGWGVVDPPEGKGTGGIRCEGFGSWIPTGQVHVSHVGSDADEGGGGGRKGRGTRDGPGLLVQGKERDPRDEPRFGNEVGWGSHLRGMDRCEAPTSGERGGGRDEWERSPTRTRAHPEPKGSRFERTKPVHVRQAPTTPRDPHPRTNPRRSMQHIPRHLDPFSSPIPTHPTLRPRIFPGGADPRALRGSYRTPTSSRASQRIRPHPLCRQGCQL